MIKGKLSNGNIVIGIAEENVERLKFGEPIVFNLKDLGLEDRLVMIRYGKTIESLYEEMMDDIDLNKTKINFNNG